MKHYGDITKIKGNEIEPVDIITGGSPCQDLSVAGKRAGLAGERSGLFMEQIRIIKEMRENDRANGRTDVDIRPRYMVWENVPGAFSSNGGEDFRAVLEETAKVAEGNACIPRFEGGRWPHAGCVMGNGWSIAWRVHDAQFWGVPQRRKRIALVADFGGATAPEILFERESMSGDSKPSGTQEQGIAEDVKRGIGKASEPILLESNQKHATIQTNGVTTTLPASMGMGGGYVPMAIGADMYNHTLTGNVAATLNATSCKTASQSGPSVIGFNRERCGAVTMEDAMPTLQAAAGESGNNQPMVCAETFDVRISSDGTKNWRAHAYPTDISRSLDTAEPNPNSNHGGVVVIEGNGARPSHKGDGYAQSETSYTLNAVEQHAVCYSQDAYDKYTENEKGAAIKQSGGNIGGGSESIVIQSGRYVQEITKE